VDKVIPKMDMKPRSHGEKVVLDYIKIKNLEIKKKNQNPVEKKPCNSTDKVKRQMIWLIHFQPNVIHG